MAYVNSATARTLCLAPACMTTAAMTAANGNRMYRKAIPPGVAAITEFDFLLCLILKCQVKRFVQIGVNR